MCTPSRHDSEPKGNTIDSIPYNQYQYYWQQPKWQCHNLTRPWRQSTDVTNRIDWSWTRNSGSITIQENFYETFVTIPVSTFSKNFVLSRKIVTCLFIFQRLIHFHPPYGMVFHSRVHQLIKCIAQHMFNTFVYGYQKP